MQSVSAYDAKARFGQLLDRAGREPVVIERHGLAVAVVLSKEEYDELNDSSSNITVRRSTWG
jgi:prevent-host-death family protein